VIADEGLNVTKLESRRGRARPWEYVFYVDVEGTSLAADAGGAGGLAERTLFVKVLGLLSGQG
jgi:prephenate dehydratase